MDARIGKNKLGTLRRAPIKFAPPSPRLLAALDPNQRDVLQRLLAGGAVEYFPARGRPRPAAPVRPEAAKLVLARGPGAGLTVDSERLAFKLFNQARQRLAKLVKAQGRRSLSSRQARELAAAAEMVDAWQAAIVATNTGLLFTVARKYAAGGDPGELIAAGFDGLIRSVSLFDVRVGRKFSTYAYLAIRSVVWRAWQKLRKQRRGVVATIGTRRELMEMTDRRGFAPEPANERTARRAIVEAEEEATRLAELQAKLPIMLAALTPAERVAVEVRFGFRPGESGRERDGLAILDDVGAALGGVSRERARQVVHKAVRKLRAALLGPVAAAI